MSHTIDLMPAAGWCKTVEHVRALARIPVITHIVMGSFTVAPRDGNTGGTNFFVRDDGTSFNSLGLPNGGLPYLELHLREMVEITHAAGKKAVLSIAGDAPGEYLTLVYQARACGVDIIEVNFGCPNKFTEGGEQQEIASYNRELMSNTMAFIKDARIQTPLWIKLSPYANPAERVRVADFIAVSYFEGVPIRRITTSNTFPNCRPRDDKGTLLITAKNTNGRAGMAGSGLLDIALANAEHFRELLPKDIGINGAGGISSGAHLASYHRIGCTGVQIGTAFFKGENFRIFEEVMGGFLDTFEAV